MWLHLPNSFISIVQPAPSDHIDGDVLVVRARVRDDLDALRRSYMPGLGPTIETPHRDYGYRAFCARASVAEGLAKAVLDGIRYGNFKDEVAKQLGPRRAALCAEIWSIMQRAEDPPRSYPSRRPRRPVG